MKYRGVQIQGFIGIIICGLKYCEDVEFDEFPPAKFDSCDRILDLLTWDSIFDSSVELNSNRSVGELITFHILTVPSFPAVAKYFPS